jgi:hypothetical protein
MPPRRFDTLEEDFFQAGERLGDAEPPEDFSDLDEPAPPPESTTPPSEETDQEAPHPLIGPVALDTPEPAR